MCLKQIGLCEPKVISNTLEEINHLISKTISWSKGYLYGWCTCIEEITIGNLNVNLFPCSSVLKYMYVNR